MVIPAYNPGSPLKRSIASVLAQTFRDFELLIVDDGSPEDVSWVETIDDPRVRLLRQKNRGVSVARNVAVYAAQAPLVAFLDQDDEWLPDKLSRQVDLLSRSPDAAFYYTDFEWVFSDRVIKAVHHEPITFHGLLADQHVCLSSVLIARDKYVSVGGHDPLLAQMQDFDLFLRLAMDAPAPVRTPQRLVRYHVHDANASRDDDTARRERTAILQAHMRRGKRRAEPLTVAACQVGLARTRTLYGAQAYDNARVAVRSRKPRPALVQLGRALRLDPKYVSKAVAQNIWRRASLLSGTRSSRLTK